MSTSSVDLKLDFSTFLGGSNSEQGNGITVDSQGNCYVTGTTFSSNFPTKNAFQSTFGGLQDAFVAKFNSTGSLVFSTFLGGNSSDVGVGIAVDSQGNSYVIGLTSSPNFPTKNAYNSTYGGYVDVFVAKFNSTGNLVFSTYLGGFSTDIGTGIAVDGQGNSYVTGYTSSDNFPTKNAYNSTYGGHDDAFVTKFNSTGSLVFSTFLGGSSSDAGRSIAVDDQGNSYVTGYTSSDNFPTKNAYNSTNGGYDDAFVTKFNSTGSLVFSTFLGGNGSDGGYGIAVDSYGNSYITGLTQSSDFPTKNAYNSTYGGFYDAFVAEFDPTGNIVFSTFLGGSNIDSGSSIAVDSQGNSYITGLTQSSNFPIKNAYNSSLSGLSDGFVAKFDSTGNLVFSTFFGGNSSEYCHGISVDSQGDSYVTGWTSSSNFPIKNAYNSTYNGGYDDVFVAKFSFPSNSTSNGLQNPLLSSLIRSLFSSAIVFFIVLPGILLVGIVTIVEYRRYSSFKQRIPNNPHSSFYKFLVGKFTRHNKKSMVPNHLSDKTFEILDEIERENRPKE